VLVQTNPAKKTNSGVSADKSSNLRNQIANCRGVRRKFSWGGLVQGHMVVICIWCAVCDVTIWRHFHVSKPTFWRSLL